jgi:hypothetical protein
MAHVQHPSPQERRKQLNLWVTFFIILVLVALAALALVLLLQDDTGGSGGTTTTSAAPAPTTPEEYAQALYAAWTANDRAGASQYGSPEAVTQLFQVPYQPLETNEGPQDPYRFIGCEGAAGSEVCTWSGEDNAQIVMTVRDTTGGLPVLVVQVQRQGG